MYKIYGNETMMATTTTEKNALEIERGLAQIGYRTEVRTPKGILIGLNEITEDIKIDW